MSTEKHNGGRKIIHIDMDAFYASVEQRDFPELRGKPIAVGGGGKRGVTTTASYEARAFGVRSAMPGWKARELCPEIVFVPPRFNVYRQVSRQIRQIFARYTDLIEPLSLDEAFLDVTSNKKGEKIATKIAGDIRFDIKTQTGLTASAGISYCKFLAKIASDVQKPDGQTVITPKRAEAFIEQLPVRKFFGVGKVTAAKMEAMGLFTGKDLKQLSLEEMIRSFGKTGRFYYQIVRGIDDRPVEANRVRKSLAVENTFENDTSDVATISEYLQEIGHELFRRLEKYGFQGRTLTLKIKNSDFVIKTRSTTLAQPVLTAEELLSYAEILLDNNTDLLKNIRLIGLTVSNPALPSSSGQLALDF